MPSRRRYHYQARPSRPYALAQAGVRLLAWITSLAAILLLAYVCKEWSSKSQVIIAGAVGVSLFSTDEFSRTRLTRNSAQSQCLMTAGRF